MERQIFLIFIFLQSFIAREDTILIYIYIYIYKRENLKFLLSLQKNLFLEELKNCIHISYDNNLSKIGWKEKFS